MTLDDLAAALGAHGLLLLGGFAPTPQDAVPECGDGVPTQYLMLAGMAGSTVWPQFSQSPEYRDGGAEPLDRWSARIGRQLARQFGARVLLPFEGPPYLPFQRWARRCVPVEPSPLGLLLHAQFGLWHAFRFALAFPSTPAPGVLHSPAPLSAASPDLCARCVGQPCLQTCPVQAFTGSAYRVDDCADWLRQEGGQDCVTLGCRARRACPVGEPWRYIPEHAAFHMAAFIQRHPG